MRSAILCLTVAACASAPGPQVARMSAAQADAALAACLGLIADPPPVTLHGDDVDHGPDPHPAFASDPHAHSEAGGVALFYTDRGGDRQCRALATPPEGWLAGLPGARAVTVQGSALCEAGVSVTVTPGGLGVVPRVPRGLC